MIGVAEATHKAGVLSEALPYIRRYSGQSVVVKIGGAALDDETLASVVAEDVALLALVGLQVIVVHGGGPQVSAAMESAGLEPRFVGGLRVTDAKAVEIVAQVLVGSINTRLVTRLRLAGANAVGLSGVDGGLLQAERTVGPNGEGLGEVGSVTSVNTDVITALLDSGHTPVIATVAAGSDAGLLNVNADAAAGAIAAAVGAAKLVYLTNVEGLYRDLGDEDSLLSEVKSGDLRAMTPTFGSGMRPKAESALAALDGGVQKVHILDGRVPHALLLEIFTSEGIGTQVLP